MIKEGARVGVRGFGLLLVMLALAVRLVLPPGLMPDANGKLVACTGHGPMRMAMGSMHPAAAERPDHPAKPAQADRPCGFGDLQTGPAPGPLAIQRSQTVAFRTVSEPARSDQAPGLGLPAPPPPSQGPPLLL